MKRLLLLLAIFLPFVSALAQSQHHSIVIDASTLAPVQTDMMSGVAIDKIGKDSSKRPCARIKMHINRMTRADIEQLKVVAVGGNVVIMKQEAAIDGNGLIIEITAKESTRFYLQHDKYGVSNEVSLNLEGDKEYRLSAQLNITYSIVVRSNIRDAEVYVDNTFHGRTNEDYTLTINDITAGAHKLKVQSGTSFSEETIEVSSKDIYFRLDINAESLKPQYVVFEITPKDATVIIDHKSYIPNDGRVETLLYNGTHEYQISASNYHEESGTFTMNGSKITKNISLKPAFGWVSIASSSTLGGASVYIDDNLIGKVPVKSGKLPSGEHKIKITQSLYLPFEGTIVIKDNETLNYSPTLAPNFATVTLTSANGADIYINGVRKGTTTWTGKLETGLYIFEASKDKHRTTTLNQEIKAEPSQQTIVLDAPEPITGTINLTSPPTKAIVKVDDSYVGETPLVTDLLIGTHKIVVTKQDYKSESTTVTIEEGKSVTISLSMLEERTPGSIMVTSNLSGTDVSIDGVYVGTTPLKFLTDAGTYNVEVTQPGYISESKEVTVSGGAQSSFYGDLKPKFFTRLKSKIGPLEVDELFPRIGFSYGFGLLCEYWKDLNYEDDGRFYSDYYHSTRSSFGIMLRLWDYTSLFNLTTGVQLTTYEAELGHLAIPAILNIRVFDIFENAIPYIGIGTEVVSWFWYERMKYPAILQFGIAHDHSEFCISSKLYHSHNLSQLFWDGDYKYYFGEVELRFTFYF